MENLAGTTKTIRVSFCDPDATDSSSDEGSGKSQKRSKRKVQVEFVEKNQDPPSNSGDFQEEMGFKKTNLKMVGVRPTRSGKFWAEIKDPIKRRWVWLGVFGTAEAASRAYLAEESKFAATKLRAQQRVELDASQNSPFQDLVVLGSHNPPTSAGKKIEGVLMTSSGKFGAAIKDPFKRKRVWLGSFTTAEEASRVYLAKKAELGANQLRVQKLRFQAKMLRDKRRIDGVAGKPTLEDSVSPVGTSDLTSIQGGARTRISHVRRTKSGKFSASITDPISKRSIWLGSFVTGEEASRVYLAMEDEFAAEKSTADRSFDTLASDKPTFQDSASSVLHNGTSGSTSFEEASRTRISDVRRRNSAKCSAVAEAASRANLAQKSKCAAAKLRAEEAASQNSPFQKTQFEAKILRAKRRIASGKSTFQDRSTTRTSGICKTIWGKFSAAITHPITKRRVWIGTFSSKQKASGAYRAKETEFKEELRAKQCFEMVAYEKSSVPGSVSSLIEIEALDLSNETGGEDSVGKTKVSRDQEAGFGFFNGVQVVDKNGFLVGEFSMLDDLSI